MAAIPYAEPGYKRARRQIIRPGARCHLCGLPASEVDHVPALHEHRHVEGSGCCRWLPACNACQRRQGAALGGAQHWTRPQPDVPELDPPPPASPDEMSSVWDACPWLESLRAVPGEGRWPRYMTAPHPQAVGSYGPEAVGWVTSKVDVSLRWWQELVLYRILEHDDQGALVWLDALVSTSRQSGKSTFLRCLSTWRLHQAGRFGEPQTILHTGKDLPVCREVQKPAMQWAADRGYPVRLQNGNEQITEPASGSRWIIRGRKSVYGYPASLVLVDEAWGVAPGVVDDGLEPTMAERRSPQLVLASTAHRQATVLVTTRRAACLDDLDRAAAPTLMVEWSAPRGVDVDDEAGWRAASPHWSSGRQRLLEARLRRVHAGETLDPDEDDPAESFLAQYLNVWPVRTGAGSGTPLLREGVWDRCHLGGADTAGEPLWIGVEDNWGNGAAVAAVARWGDGFEIDGWRRDTWDDAQTDAALLASSRPGSRIVVGASMWAQADRLRPQPDKAGATETRLGLAVFRQLAQTGRIVHDSTPDLDAQLAAARVRPVPGGGLTFISNRPTDVIRAAVWALLAAQARRPAPAIH